MMGVFRGVLTGVLFFLILGLRVAAAPNAPSGPAFSSIPELEQGYRRLYEQKFPEARDLFQKWAAEHPDEPFGQVSIAASYLFEEFFLLRILTSDYFLDDKRFLGGITGKPNPERIKGFEDAVGRARSLALHCSSRPERRSSCYVSTGSFERSRHFCYRRRHRPGPLYGSSFREVGGQALSHRPPRATSQGRFGPNS
jgi:hypothetical protein